MWSLKQEAITNGEMKVEGQYDSLSINQKNPKKKSFKIDKFMIIRWHE